MVYLYVKTTQKKEAITDKYFQIASERSLPMVVYRETESCHTNSIHILVLSWRIHAALPAGSAQNYTGAMLRDQGVYLLFQAFGNDEEIGMHNALWVDREADPHITLPLCALSHSRLLQDRISE